jgi:hypothetical protein
MILKVADRTPHAPWMPAFASGPSWTIAVGVRQRDLLDWLLGQNRPVLFIEPNERFADRLRQEGLDKWTDLYELVEVSLGSDKTEIPWYSYDSIKFLENFLQKNHHVFEYGCGASTLFFSKRLFINCFF